MFDNGKIYLLEIVSFAYLFVCLSRKLLQHNQGSVFPVNFMNMKKMRKNLDNLKSFPIENHRINKLDNITRNLTVG